MTFLYWKGLSWFIAQRVPYTSWWTGNFDLAIKKKKECCPNICRFGIFYIYIHKKGGKINEEGCIMELIKAKMIIWFLQEYI